MSVLLIGGHGYIGSHVAIALARHKKVVIVDDHSNSNSDVGDRIGTVLGPYAGNIRHYNLTVATSYNSIGRLEDIIRANDVESVIHLAGLKSVGESTQRPLLYLAYNTELLYSVLCAMRHTGVKKILFSSTAALYGNGSEEPLGEDSPIVCTNAYSESKHIQELVLRQLAAQNEVQFTILRYFNPIGNDPSGILGENPPSKPNNVLPYMLRCVGTHTPFTVFGNDYNTVDGTGVRDYIDVCDLADAHVKVITEDSFENETYNVGYGTGTSVLQLVEMVQNLVGTRYLSYDIGPRRPGDIGMCVANPKKFIDKFNWVPKSNVEKAIESHWKWELRRRVDLEKSKS